MSARSILLIVAAGAAIGSGLGCDRDSGNHRTECERWVTRWMEGPPGEPGWARELEFEPAEFDEMRSKLVNRCTAHAAAERPMYECIMRSSSVAGDTQCIYEAQREVDRQRRAFPWRR